MNSSDQYLANIRLLTVDSSTGKLTESPKVQASYGPNYYFTAALFGFNPAGSQLYDTWGVSFDGEDDSSYYSRTIDPETGTLGPSVYLFAWDDWMSADQVRLTNNLIIDLSRPFEGPETQSIKVYPLINNPATPLILCDSAMLATCSTTSGILVDPSGQYLFLSPGYPYWTSDNTTHIAKIELGTKKIVDTGYSIPGSPQILFSPDGRLVYGVTLNYNSDSTIDIYRFNKSNGAVTRGEELTQSALNGVYPAARQ
jgi:hypothetical protein